MQQICQLIILYIDKDIFFKRKVIGWEKTPHQLCKNKSIIDFKEYYYTLLHLKSETLRV